MSDQIMLQAFCDWQIFGDVDPYSHMNDLLRPWHGKGADGADGDLNHYLEDFEVTFSNAKGPFGLRYVQFWVKTPLDADELNQAKRLIKQRLNQMVGDTDVSVRFVIRAE